MTDSWPFARLDWNDSPWVLAGRVVTAWFEVPWEVVERSLAPDLLPEPAPRKRIRLRFYELRFRAEGAHPSSLAPAEGTFHEAVVAFPARAGSFDGEISAFMWADDATYSMWAREAFGFPIMPGEIELEGGLWRAPAIDGQSGSARVRSPHGTAALLDIRVGEPLGTGSPASRWLVPRRVLHRGGAGGETREVLALRPAVRRAGELYGGAARIELDFAAGHPLHGVEGADPELHIVDGFELVVGEDVELASAVTRSR